MVEYLLLFFAVLCIGGQFSLTKLYQLRTEGKFFPSMLFSFFSALSAAVILAAACRFNISFRWFSFFMAAGSTCCIILYTILGIKMMSFGRVAVYTMFIMLGGMIIPFFYGIVFLGEKLTVWKIVGLVFLVVALLLPIFKKETGRNRKPFLFMLLSVIVFLMNGFVGVFNKIHQISKNPVSTFEFGFWQNAIGAAVLLIVILCCFAKCKEKRKIKDAACTVFKQWWIILGFMLFSQLGSVFQLFAAKSVEASVMFPLVTGGTIFISAIFGRIFFKEKLSKSITFSLIVSVGAALMFLF